MIDIFTYIVMTKSVNKFGMSTTIVYKSLAAQLKSTAELKSVKSPTLLTYRVLMAASSTSGH